MDLIAREILRRELIEDARIIAKATDRAVGFLSGKSPGYLEATAYELHRGYNIMELALERVCRACENHLDPGRDYHERLLERMALDLPGIRPAFLSGQARRQLREWKGFRHVVRHAYDLEFDPDRLEQLTHIASNVSQAFPSWIDHFFDQLPAEKLKS